MIFPYFINQSKTRVRTTSETVVDDTEVPHQRHRDLRVRKVGLQVNISTMFIVYYESRNREVTMRLMNEGRCDERLKVRVEESTYLTYTGLHDKTN